MGLPAHVVRECERALERIRDSGKNRTIYWLGKKLGFKGENFEIVGTYTPHADVAQVTEDLEAWFAEYRLPSRKPSHKR